MPARLRWILRMAWRDSRGSRTHLLLSVATIAVGMAALVAIRSFGDQFQQAIDRQALTLLGADLVLRSTQPYTAEAESLIASIPGEHTRETRFYSMVEFPGTDFIRLSHVRALDGEFPFYGEIQTDPPEAAGTFRHDKTVLVEENLMIQAGAEVGDTLRIGNQAFTIAGRLLHIAGEAPASAAFMGPRVYLDQAHLPDTQLLGEGSIARFLVYIKLPPDITAAQIQSRLRPDLNRLRIRFETAEQRKAMVGDSLVNIYRYLNLGSLAAFLLGGIGLAGSIQLYVRKKRTTVAILRCLGSDAASAFSIYVVQATAAAGLGTVLGALGGSLLQRALPVILADFLPVTVEPGWSWSSIGLSLIFGFLLAWAFALLPLMAMRAIPPLEALRPVDTTGKRRRIDGAMLGLGVFILGVLALFAVLHTEPRSHGLFLTAAIAGVFALLALTARLLIHVAKLMPADRWGLAWRHGIANLHRPGHQTPILLLSLGVGVFLITLMALLQSSLQNQFRRADQDNRPNLILFDIQPDQVAPLRTLIRERNLDVVETAPIITMRLAAVNGRRVGELRDDPTRDIPNWALFREYRSTYRETLTESETLVRGEWIPRMPPNTSVIPISLEDDIAETLGIGIGSRLDFDLQGVLIRTRVASLRKVDWRQLRTNFFVVFPAGVLESAPHYLAMVTRAPDAGTSARLQQAVVADFPNVSAIDLRLIVQSMDDVLGKASWVIQFLALLCIITGLLVMAATVVAGRADRREETHLLHILGATRTQLLRIMAVEHLLLGGLSALTGIVLAVVAGWSLSYWGFDMPFAPSLLPLVVIPIAFMFATLLTGFLATSSHDRKSSP